MLLPCHGEGRRAQPLFCDGGGRPLRHASTDAAFKDMLRAAGVGDERAATMSMHSWRSYLACALLASNATPAQILSMLRWRSEEALRVYARLNDTAYATWLDAAGRARVTSVRTTNVAALARADGVEMRAEAEREATEQRQWLERAAAAHVEPGLMASIPSLSNDELMGAVQAAGGGLRDKAARLDADIDAEIASLME